MKEEQTAKQPEDNKEAKPEEMRTISTSKSISCYEVPFSSASRNKMHIPIFLLIWKEPRHWALK